LTRIRYGFLFPLPLAMLMVVVRDFSFSYPPPLRFGGVAIHEFGKAVG
jgi:hypothetical protein